MSAVEPRVFFRLSGCFRIGPVGCFDVGEHVDIEGGDYVVTAVEPDGVAVAFPAGSRLPSVWDLASVLDQLDRAELVAIGQVRATERQCADMATQIRANRVRHGLPPIEREAA